MVRASVPAVERRRRNVTCRPVLTTAPGARGVSAVRPVTEEPRDECATVWRATVARARPRRSWSVTRTVVRPSPSGQSGVSVLRSGLGNNSNQEMSQLCYLQSCGGGSRQRERHCEAGGEPVCDCQCYGPIQEFESCATSLCPEWSPWSSWSSKLQLQIRHLVANITCMWEQIGRKFAQNTNLTQPT